jgi:hypothetical protein
MGEGEAVDDGEAFGDTALSFASCHSDSVQDFQ